MSSALSKSVARSATLSSGLSRSSVRVVSQTMFSRVEMFLQPSLVEQL